MQNLKIPQFVLNALVVIAIATYGFVFSSVVGRITKNETDIKNLDPMMLQIQTDLAEIKTDIKWMMKSKAALGATR